MILYIYIAHHNGRHHDCIKLMIQMGVQPPIRGIQGFITDVGTFMNRHESKAHAIACNQIYEDNMISNILTSEDLW